MYELLGEIKDIHVMELPWSQHKESYKALWFLEIRFLKKKIEKNLISK
jgi:benzoyl-CoA reductase/2-hydroxyglutaryl-CoA dehydratase subunit BcrC/BadD/HgdB